ncbi:hypothetical protein [Streptomyces sp. NPDC093591]|uniref:hypothetical protein n=1 Tax=Streptomyces sp. NPDC093591 TaxID=3366044 RepID=UPI003811382B
MAAVGQSTIVDVDQGAASGPPPGLVIPGRETAVLRDQVRTIDTRFMCGDPVDHLTGKDMAEVESELGMLLRLRINLDYQGASFRSCLDGVVLCLQPAELAPLSGGSKPAGNVSMSGAHVPLTIASEAAPLALPSGRPVAERALTSAPDAAGAGGLAEWGGAARLVLANIELSKCLFTKTVHPDQLRVEATCTFDEVPPGPHWLRWWRPVRFTQRRTLAEEHHGRASRLTAVAGWNVAVLGAGHTGPAQLTPVYRSSSPTPRPGPLLSPGGETGEEDEAASGRGGGRRRAGRSGACAMRFCSC